MTRSLPGARLHRLLLRWAPATIVRDVLEPALADLQYEAERAPTVRAQRQIILGGHVAIVRALICSIEPGGAIRAALALSALCAVGTLLMTAALARHVDQRVLNSTILGPGMLAPVVLRMLGITSSRRLFLASLLVASLTPVLAGGLGLEGGHSWSMRVERALSLLVVLAPLAAVAAIAAGPNRASPSQRAVAAVSLGSGIATVALLVVRWPQGQHLSIGLAMSPFYATLFAMLFGLTLLPLLLLARAFIARPAPLAIAGLLCSPAPLIAGAYLDHGTLTACLDAFRRTPFAFAASSLPFVTGAITVGWCLTPLAQRPHPSLFRW